MGFKGIQHRAVREFLAEIYGTFILVLFATAAGCQMTLSRSQLSTFLTVNLAGGVGVGMAIYVSGGASGGAVNPAVTLAFCLTNRTPWRLLPVHWVAQILGAFMAAAVTFGVYKDALDEYDGGERHEFGINGTAAMFTSFPQAYVSTTSGLFDQIVGTGLLITCIMAFLDPRNMQPSKGIVSMLTAAVVFAIGGTFGLNCSYPLNPARDFGPRLFLLLAGWSTDVFSHRDYNWFWVPLVGPLLGSAAGVFLYYLFVGFHWPSSDSHDVTCDTDDPTEKIKGNADPGTGTASISSASYTRKSLDSYATTDGSPNCYENAGYNYHTNSTTNF